MTAIVLNTELVSTRYDRNTGVNFYTVEKGGRRWTVGVHTDEFNRHGFGPGHKQRRQNHLTRAILEAMQGPDDEMVERAKEKAPQDAAQAETVRRAQEEAARSNGPSAA